jgi:hypothetical protein
VNVGVLVWLLRGWEEREKEREREREGEKRRWRIKVN